MKKALALSKLYIDSLYGLSGFTSDLKTNKKAVLKKVSFVILIAASFSGMVAMLAYFNSVMYDSLKSINQESLILTSSVIFASLTTLIFGISGIIANYFVDMGGEIILSMPFEPWNILFAKYVSNYIYETLISTVIMATGFVVYGVKGGEGILFYIVSVLISLAVPIVPLAISYFIVIPLMRAGNFLKNKDVSMILSGFIAVIFAVLIQIFGQKMAEMEMSQNAIVEKFASPNGLVSVSGKIYYPSIWATYAMSGAGTLKGFLNFIIFIAVSFGFVFLLITLMSNIYAESIARGQESNKSNKKFTESEFKAQVKKNSRIKALLNREIKLMNREPTYFLNGPFEIFFIPLFLGIMLFIQGEDVSKQLSQIPLFKDSSYYATLIALAFAEFLGVSANVTSTAISREGKGFNIIKSMPIYPKEFIEAKLLHGYVFDVIASVMISVIYLFFDFSILNALIILIISIIASSPFIILGLLIELKYPKLNWDNPQKAVKQNMNAVIIMFGNMGFIAALCLISFKFIKSPLAAYSFILSVSLILSLIFINWLFRYAEKRFYEIEI
jgi:ABC-2 type transport system permease protein